MLGLLRGGVDARRDLQQRQLDGLIEVGLAEAGLHLAAWLLEGKDGRHCVGPPPERWRRYPSGAYGIEASLQPGLLPGYAAFSEEEISPKG